MRCRRHPGCEADNVCLECGGNFCPQCVKETGVAYQCPDCRDAEIERIAARLGVRRKSEKKREGKKPEASTRAEVLGLEEEEPGEALPEVEEEHEEVIVAKEEFPSVQKRRLRRPKEDRGESEILFLKEIPARVEDEPEAAGVDFQIGHTFGDSTAEVGGEPGEASPGGETMPPRPDSEDFWKDIHRARKRRRARKKSPIEVQYPDEYEDHRTVRPGYLKALGFGALAGAICAGAYGGIAWWRHREFGIVGWVIGAAIALAVVYGSGKHFNLRLGLMSAVLALLFVSAGRIFVYMLEVWFPDIIKLPIGTLDNFNHAMKQFVNQLPTQWLAFLMISVLVAFLLSFRPWPLRLRTSSGGGEGQEGSTARKA